MGRKVVILAVEPWYRLPLGGTQQAMITLAEGLVKTGATVYALGPRGSKLPSGVHLIDMGRSILDRGIDWRNLRSVQQVHAEMVEKIEEVLRSHSRDEVVLHVQWSYAESGLLYELLRREVKVPTVLTKHTVFPALLSGASGWNLGGEREENIISQFPAVAISKYDRRDAPGHFRFIESITHGLPDVYFNNRWPGERIGGGCLGTYSERKGFLYAYEAARMAGETRFESAGLCNASEHFAYRREIQRRFLNEGFGEDLGEIDLAQKLRWLPGLRYYLVPIQLPEPLNLTVLEALASGVPVIAHNIGAMDEMIRDEVNGHLVRVNDTEAMADHIQRINAMSSREMNAWAQRIRNAAKRDYSAQAMAERYLTVYDRVRATYRG